MGQCPVRERLLEETEQALARIAELSAKQLQLIRHPENAKMMAIDQELEQRVGEKERLFGALRQHRAEHGC
jgi:hypothetical protein